MYFLLTRSIVVLFVAFAVLLLWIPPALHAQNAQPEVVGTTNSFQARPRTDGQYVVWVQLRSGIDDTSESAYYDLYASDLGSRTQQRIVGGPGSVSDPDVDRGIVVWAQSSPESPIRNRDIVAKNLATGQQFTIAATPTDETRPAISGNLVVWISDDGSTPHLMGRSIGGNAQPFVVAELASTQSMSPERRPALDGKRVMWIDTVRQPDGLYSFPIRTVEIGSHQQPVTLYELGGDGFAVSGNTAVISIGRQITVFNLATGQQRVIPSFGDYPTTDGRYVFWQMMYAGGPVQIPKLAGYDLEENRDLLLNETLNAYAMTPFLHNGIVTWVGALEVAHGQTVLGIDATTVHELLTLAPPQPTPDPNRTTFPQTGHSLGGTFRAYWERNGGLAVFGYPMREEIQERNPDTGQTYTTQYFERQRFELHPENAGTPYEVLLGRLGAQEAERRGLLTSAAFQPVVNSPSPRGSCDHFPETQHWTCGSFWLYWQNHGLEFGDPGFSFRESLALFGAPISEPFVDPASGFMTQYFERARFEYHPENKPPYDVLLGRLGAALAPNQ